MEALVHGIGRCVVNDSAVGLTDRDLDPYDDEPDQRPCSGDCDTCRKPWLEDCP